MIALVVGGLVLLAFFVLFLLTFRNTHPYNVDWTDYFIRNRLLVFFSQGLMHKILFFVPVALAFLYLCAARLKQTAFYALYPATVLYLAPSWLIEQRYYIPPVVLFLLFRERDEERIEWIMTVVWAAISLSLLYVIERGKFFF